LYFIIPVHPNPNVRPVFAATLQNITNVHLTDPMGYDEILYLMQRSAIILTDSGGIQEEAPAFNVPLLVLRNETERPEGIAAGCSILVGTSAETIEKHFLEIMQNPEIYKKMATTANPYGDGQASRRIADILCV
jgi:UDP-N-acetylglucosamine 2-epimerase